MTKTDRRDAQKLADLLWLNRGRLATGQVVRGLRRVHLVSDQEREDHQLTSLRKTLGQRHIRTVNKVRRIVNRHNLIWQYPTKTFQTRAGRRWLKEVSLPANDRLEINVLLEEWEAIEKQIDLVDQEIAQRAIRPDSKETLNATQILMTTPGVSYYSGLTLASRIGPIERFPRPRSLHHRLNRTNTESQGPKRSGSSRHGAPV